MKVLWFTSTPALGEYFLNKNILAGCGWIKSLNKEIEKDVELHIAFYYDKPAIPFQYSNTNYYPIVKVKTKFKKLIDAKFSRISKEEDINKYLDIINTVQPDIIHIHGSENPFVQIIKKTTIPIVISIQGILTVCHHKFNLGLDEKYLNTSKNLLTRTIGYKPFKIAYKTFEKKASIEKNSLSICNNIIGRTDWDNRISKILAPNAKYFHNDEILRDGFYKNKWQPNYNDKFIVFTTNGNAFYKGFETIALTVSLLIKSGFTNFEWRVAGISKNSLIVKATKKLLKKQYPKSNLVLLGILNEQKLIDNLLVSNLYVMPSHIENSPNNLCEAMILGMPCIATFSGGTGSLLSDKEDGILIQDGDPWVMAGAIKELYNDADTSIKYGNKARNKALKRHNKKKISRDLISIYNKIILNM